MELQNAIAFKFKGTSYKMAMLLQLIFTDRTGHVTTFFKMFLLWYGVMG